MSKTQSFKRRVILILSLVMLVNCASESFDSSASSSGAASGDSIGKTTSTVAGGNISELTVANDSITIPFHVDDSETVAIMLVGLNSSGKTQGFEIGSFNSNSQSLQSSFAVTDNDDEDSDNTEDAHEILRGLEEQIFQDQPEPASNSNTLFATTSENDSDVQSFKVVQSFSSNSSYTTVSGEKIYSGEYFDLYIDSRDIDEVLEDSDYANDLIATAQEFDDIIPTEREIFGHESDVNGDGKFDILITREVNEIGQQYGGLVTGFFYATDLFSTYDSSNEREVFYVLRPDPNGTYGSKVPLDLDLQITKYVFPHEYQHMISFNRHYFINGTSSEASWLNEGLAHLAEDIYSYDENGYMPNPSLENYSRLSKALREIDKVCFTCGSDLSQRGLTYGILRYIYEQAFLGNVPNVADGNEFIGNLLEGSRRDLKNLNFAVSGSDNNYGDLYDLIAKSGLAFYLSNTGQTTDDRYQFDGLNLRSVQNDNRGTVLNGPAIIKPTTLPYTDTLQGFSFAYLQLSGQTINDAGGTLELQLGSNANFRAFLIE